MFEIRSLGPSLVGDVTVFRQCKDKWRHCVLIFTALSLFVLSFLQVSSTAMKSLKEITLGMAVQRFSFHSLGLGAELHHCGQTRSHLNMRVIEVTEIVETDSHV